MRLLNKKSLFFILLAWIYANANATSSPLKELKWTKIKDQAGIQVYIPTEYSHASGLVPIRFKATLKFPVWRVLSVLADDKRKTEWLPRSKEVKLIEKATVENFTVYYRYDSPWPFKDREFLIQNIAKLDKSHSRVVVTIKSVEHTKAPLLAATVRGKTFDGYSIVTPVGHNETLIEMAFLNDFGGFIPKFLINIVQKKWPFKFMQALRLQLSKKDILLNPSFNPKDKVPQ